MDLDLRKLRYFVAVADKLHFGRAADELHIAQPVLSRQIRALEQDLGTPLLTRDSHGVMLTDAGRQLLTDAGPLLASAHAVRRRVTVAARGSQRLMVGFRAGVAVTAAVQLFATRHPDVLVDMQRIGGRPGHDAARRPHRRRLCAAAHPSTSRPASTEQAAVGTKSAPASRAPPPV